MNGIELESIYWLVENIANASNKYSKQELAELEHARFRVDSDLQEESSGLASCLASAKRAIDSANEDELVESLIRLRIHVMDIATTFDNLALEIALLFERKAIRTD